MRYKYNVHRGLSRIKTKMFTAVTILGLMLGGGGLSLINFGTAHALSPVWNVSGSYQINVVYLGTPYPETLNLTQSGANITGGDLNTNPPAAGSAFTVTGGTVTGNNIDFNAQQDTSTLAVHFSGTIAPTGTMDGNWGDVSPGTRIGTWATTSGAAIASSIKDFDSEKNLNKSQCLVTKKSTEVVDVSFKLINDYDSAVHGNNWANDTIHRQLNIWKTDGNFCAIVRDNGHIVTLDGDSPNGTGHISAGINGTIDGGYNTGQYVSTFLSNPAYSKHGYLGTFDLQCNTDSSCPGAHPSILSYTPDWAFSQPWWGWQYTTCHNGNWVNSSEGNFGDITDNVLPKDKHQCHQDKDNDGHDGDHIHRDKGDQHDRDKHRGPSF